MHSTREVVGWCVFSLAVAIADSACSSKHDPPRLPGDELAEDPLEEQSETPGQEQTENIQETTLAGGGAPSSGGAGTSGGAGAPPAAGGVSTMSMAGAGGALGTGGSGVAGGGGIGGAAPSASLFMISWKRSLDQVSQSEVPASSFGSAVATGAGCISGFVAGGLADGDGRPAAGPPAWLRRRTIDL